MYKIKINIKKTFILNYQVQILIMFIFSDNKIQFFDEEIILILHLHKIIINIGVEKQIFIIYMQQKYKNYKHFVPFFYYCGQSGSHLVIIIPIF